MSSGNNSNGANKVDWQHVATPDLVEHVDDSLKVQIAKFDEQSCRRHDKLMKRAAEQEAQKKAEEERKKAEEEAKRVAEEEAMRLAKEEAKKKAKEDAQKRAKFQVWWKADSERKVREKAEAKAAAEAMRAQIVQKVGQGEKPKPKPKVHGMELFSSYFLLTCFFSIFSNVGWPVSARPTRKSRGGTPRATDAGRAATARAVPCLIMLIPRHANDARR